MSSNGFTVEFPERDSYGELMKGYFSLMRGFGLEFENRCHRVLRDEFGAGWLADYVRLRRLQGELKGKADLSDPSFFLKDYLFSESSIFTKVLSAETSARIAAKKIMDVRNTWLHFGEEPSTTALEEVATYIRELAEKSKMRVAVPAAQLIKRVGRIRTGQYPPVKQALPSEVSDEAPLSTTLDPQEAVVGGEAEPPASIPLDAPSSEMRPPIGGTWRGKVPERTIKVTRTGDVVDAQTGDSIRSEVVGDLTEKVRQWMSARPNEPLWLDTDGAVGGYVQGVRRLLGYTGPDPDGEVARGFLLRHFYDIRDGHLVDLDTEVALTEAVDDPEQRDAAAAAEAAIVEAAAPGGTIRVTTFGDVLYLDDDGMQRLTVVTPTTWFPGHFVV